MKCGFGRHGAVLGAASLCVVLASPARAQSTPEPQAETAIPPGSGAPQPVPLDPDAPLAPLPGLGVDWPDLSLAPEEVTADTGQTSEIASEMRYGFAIEGLDAAATPLLRQRFDELSTLKAHDGDPANAAQLDRRAREDAELLTTLLRGQGYYDAQVTTGIGRRDGKLLVTLTADPGALYHFADVTLDGVLAAGGKADALRYAFGVKTGDAVDADAIATGTADLRTAIGHEGFPFAQVDEPAIVVDHATRTATLDLSVIPGGARRFGVITTPEGSIFDGRHIQDIARFDPGDRYDATDVDDLHRALIQTGLVSSADIKPVQGSTPDTVDLAITMAPAPPRTIAGELGYGTGEGVRAEASWTHRNLFPPEGALTLRGVLGTREQLGNIVLRRNNFHARDRVLTAQVALAHTERNAYDARTFSLSGTLERQSTIFYQKAWTWSVGAELVATDERDVILSTGAPRRRTYFIGALPGTLGYDGSDDLLNPTRGFRVSGRLSPELSLSGQAFGYARTQVDASAYQPVSDGVVLAGRVRLGTIVGAPRDAIAPSRRFYAGGGGSVRGYGYQDIGPRDPNNDPIGGRSLTEFSIEARVKAFGNFGVVPFLDAGNIYTSPLPKFSHLRFGTGLGVRYYSSFGPIRVDVGTPINPQKGDPRIAVYVSLGQAF
ncbi:autotransporter secretion outer membrane protein TamA [Hephaestia caeni]|uniref:Autotransporter secretion outer membrane protein TamA n=1 Tax=Hephaestia caeni TaxID=645617 RepID=A0A397NSE1_9SPHN|nr:BamA/TamA family outer membrane protein [Hephaestia caeni]RIA37635.1 autotransporter secretion outer membrane protein TamA [Hephaestia caeni]